MDVELKTNNMPGKSKKGGGLEVGSAYKMKGFSGFGNSPLTDKGEVVSKTSPGKGWTKTKGTNIWAPPKEKARKIETKFARMEKSFKEKKSDLARMEEVKYKKEIRTKGKMTKTEGPRKKMSKRVEPIKRFTKTVGPKKKMTKTVGTATSKFYR